MASPLRSPRRILIALGILVLLGGGSVGVLGFAAADGEAMAVPARHEGDVVTYEDSDGETLEIRHKGMRLWHSPEGPWHNAEWFEVPAGYTEANDVRFDIVVWSLFDAMTGDALAGSTGASGGASASAGLTGSEEDVYMTVGLQPGVSILPCGILHSLQGVASPSDELRVLGCDKARTFQASGRHIWQGEEVLVYEHADRQLWLLPGMPYPVRIIDGKSSLEMTGFTRGGAPPVPEPLPEAVPVPDGVPAEVTRYGPAFDHPSVAFPVEDALAYAAEDPADPAVRDFMREHGDWYVGHAEHYFEGDSEKWWLRLDAPGAVLTVWIGRSPAATAPLADAAGLDALRWTITWRADDFGIEQDGSVHDLPATLPSLASAVAAWKAYDPANEEPDALGFWMYPAGGGTWAQVYAGFQGMVSRDQGAPGPSLDPRSEPQQTAYGGNTVYLAADGSFSEVTWTEGYQRTSGGVLAPAAAASDADGPVAAETWAAPASAAGFSLLALIASGLYYFWPAIKSGALVGYWGRRDDEHPMRTDLMGRIQQAPGIHYQQLVRETGRGKGVVEHHLRTLERDGKVRSIREGGYRCLFPAGMDPHAMAAAPALRSEGARAVYAAIRSHPGTSVSHVAQATGLSPGTVSHHLRRLRAAGAIHSARDGRTVRLHAG